jgi:predicted nucleotidyltransferase component of viral defense system
MRIDEVLTLTIVGIYSSTEVSHNLFLKGGCAMRLFDNLTSRLSIDVDFSVVENIRDDRSFFNAIKSSVEAKFREWEYDIMDFKWKKQPMRRHEKYPDWWGGWMCEFKLVSFQHRGKHDETRRRNALVPQGSNSPKIIVEISEHEYCRKTRIKTIQGVRVLGYSRELIVLEKLRAICQQHPDYAYKLSKNRARDFYDIYELTVNADNNFAGRCSQHIKKVFAAKEVPLRILTSLWDEAFIDEHRRGFDEVRDTVSDKVYDFDVYLEHLRFLVREIYPEVLAP